MITLKILAVFCLSIIGAIVVGVVLHDLYQDWKEKKED